MFNADRRLVDRCLKGEKPAFDMLYDRHATRVFNLLRRLTGSQSLAEDLTQETFIAAYRSLASWRGKGAFSTWLCGIACRQHANARRKTADREDLTQAGLTDNLADIHEEYAKREQSRRIEQAIRSLPDELREVFVLVKVEGFAYREAAACLDLPLGTVQSRLWRAVRAIQADLKQDEEEPAAEFATLGRSPEGECNET